MKLGMVMLCAGNSRRFGSNKLLHEVQEKPMYQWMLEKLCHVREKLYQTEKGVSLSLVVVTQYQEIKEQAERAGARVMINKEPERGISSSMQLGLEGAGETDACLFTVADQPWIREDTIKALILQFLSSEKGMACVSFQGKPGNPCIFSKKYYGELKLLQGDRGGKKVLLSHPGDAEFLEVTEDQELRDVDQKEMLF